LRQFFNRIVDYAALDFQGHFFISSIGHNLVLSSPKEVVAYVSSPTAVADFEYAPHGAQVRLAELPLDDGRYRAEFFDPKSGPLGSRTIRVSEGTTNFRTPKFVDDYVIHILASPQDTP